jgi:hypothetical protein
VSHGAVTSLIAMASIESVTLEVADPTAVNRFYTAAFGLGSQVRLRASEALIRTGSRGRPHRLSPVSRRNCTTAACNPGARGHR